MPHVSDRRRELSRGGPGTPSATSNLLMTALFGGALLALFLVHWCWVSR